MRTWFCRRYEHLSRWPGAPVSAALARLLACLLCLLIACLPFLPCPDRRSKLLVLCVDLTKFQRLGMDLPFLVLCYTPSASQPALDIFRHVH